MFYARSGQIVSHQYHTAQNQQRGNFYRTKVNKTWFRRPFLFLRPINVNLLPVNIKKINKIKLFSKQVITWLFGKDSIDDLIKL